jgi:hypothetical protein
MKEEVLRMSKAHLRSVVEQVDYSNLADMEKEFTRIFVILYSTRDLLKLRPVAVPVQEEMKHVAIPSAEDYEDFAKLLDESKDTIDADDGKIAYRFERKIRGGYIPDIDAFVPEKIINELDLYHGDLLYATKIKEVEDGPDHYEYELVERGSGKAPEGIVEVKYGLVEYYPSVSSGFAVRRTTTGVFAEGIIVNGERLVLPISNEDANAFKLQEDDVIDLAFYENNPENPKIRWRHSFSELRQIESTTPKPSGHYKNKKQDSKTESVEQIFKGKTVCCMGYEPGWLAFKEEIESRGGEFVGVTGRESRDTLGGILDRSDCLIMVLGHVGHGGTQWAVPYCKNKGVPYTNIKTFGRSSFVAAADRLINF